MKYDLKRLKGIADEQIEKIQPDESILDRALERGMKRNNPYLARALTAAAVCVIVAAVLSVLIVPGLKIKPDDTGSGNQYLSQGVHPQLTETPQPELPGVAVLYEEDLSLYQPYSPDFARSVLPDEAEFENVIIKRLDNADKTFVFEEKETGARVIPGQFDMAFAWFPATETGLVRLGRNEDLTLVNVLRETLDGTYSHFEYKGNGVAIVAGRDEYETEPDPMYLISTADGCRLSRDYAIIGTMTSGAVRLMMGHDDQDLLGDYDVLAMDGRVIARVAELSGTYFDEWLSVQLPGETEYCLIDMQGNEQLGGLRFSRIANEKDGMLIVWTDEGSGVIGRDGIWVFEPGRYFNIEFAGDGLFRAMDMKSGEVIQINRAGERVDTLNFRIDRFMDRLGEALAERFSSLGQLGFIIACAAGVWLVLRLGWAKGNGELKHMLFTELGFAAYIAGLFLIGHRLGGEAIVLWPTDTSTTGARALSGWWNLASFALTGSLIAIFPKLRRPKAAFLTGYALMLLPWVWKSVCGDMSVMQWRAMSEIVFAGGALLAVLLFLVKPVKRFMEGCARFDALNEYAKKTRIIWMALIALSLLNFGAGCLFSAQELVRCTQHTAWEQGMTKTLNEEWFDSVNELSAEYRGLELDNDQRLELLKEHDYSVISAVRWLNENGLEELTEDMVYSVRVTGTVELARAADVQLLIEMKGQNIMEGGEYAPSNVWQIAAEAPLAEADGAIAGRAVFLIPPGEELPDIEARLYIRQRLNADEFIAAQRYYQAELGVVLTEGIAVENSLIPAE